MNTEKEKTNFQIHVSFTDRHILQFKKIIRWAWDVHGKLPEVNIIENLIDYVDTNKVEFEEFLDKFSLYDMPEEDEIRISSLNKFYNIRKESIDILKNNLKNRPLASYMRAVISFFYNREILNIKDISKFE